MAPSNAVTSTVEAPPHGAAQVYSSRVEHTLVNRLGAESGRRLASGGGRLTPALLDKLSGHEPADVQC
jgi:hypothetical protein